MLTPIFRLATCTSWGPKSHRVVLAASGSSIYSLSVSNGSLLSRWSNALPSPGASPPPEGPAGSKTAESEPPAKRRKLSAGEDEDEASDKSPDIILLNDAAEKPRRRRPQKPVACIVKLRVTDNGRYVVAVTNEDKVVRVLEMVDGCLTQISERYMPKKPNAVVFTPDQESIIVADKFGDVYSFPLLIPETAPGEKEDSPMELEKEPELYRPTATELTVHSRQNRIALQNQIKQAQLGNQRRRPVKKPLEFDHKLLLGHVSLLTDMLCFNHPDHMHNYIITADRDEHIRISRGNSQTHVIDGFCQGHKNFVNALLIPQGLPALLISGGGDDELYVWQWQTNRLVEKINIGDHINTAEVQTRLGLPEESEPRSIAVTGLHSVGVTSTWNQKIAVFVLLEALPAIIAVELDRSGKLLNIKSRKLQGNPLDLLVDRDTNSVLVSIDPVHEPGSSSVLKPSFSSSSIPLASDSSPMELECSCLETFLYDTEHGFRDEEQVPNQKGSHSMFNPIVKQLHSWSGERDAEVDEGSLSSLFYGAEHMRKLAGTAGDFGEVAEGDEDDM